MPPHSHIDSARKFSSSRYGCAVWAASSALSTAIDCVATTASSQPPLMPRSSVGLRCLTVKAAKIV